MELIWFVITFLGSLLGSFLILSIVGFFLTLKSKCVPRPQPDPESESWPKG